MSGADHQARNMRMILFGEIAIELGFLTVAQLKDGLARQKAMPLRDRKLLGVILVEAGYLDEGQVVKVLEYAERAQAAIQPDEDADTAGLERG